MRAAITPIVTTEPTPAGAEIAPIGLDLESARKLARSARAPATTRAYDGDWRTFTAFCEARGVDALPATPETVAVYVAHLDGLGRRPASIGRALVTISQAHKLAGHPAPTSAGTVREVVKGLRRERGTAAQQKAPVSVESLRAMIRSRPKSTLIGLRDRALLALGFAGAFRRSELAALDVTDLETVEEGLVVTLRRSKTDQAGAGRKIGIPYGSDATTCAVRAVRAWLAALAEATPEGATTGRLLRSVDRHGKPGQGLAPHAIGTVVKAAALATGLDPARFAGHSLRAGLATAAARAGKSTRAIMAQTGHRSEAMVRRYIRDATLFDDNAASGIGL